MAVYDQIGANYARYRQPDRRVAQQVHEALGDARRVLDVGAGTGSYERGSRAYVAVEPSVVMLGQRAPDASQAVQGVAEQLPFSDGSFDAAMAILTIHHWGDLSSGLREVRRVTRGPIVILTWDAGRFSEYWLVREYLPEAERHDRTLASLSEVCEALGECRVEPVPVTRDCADGFFAAYWCRPEMYLDPGARAAISGIALLPQRAIERMACALEADLRSGVWGERHGDLLQQDTYDGGYRLVVA